MELIAVLQLMFTQLVFSCALEEIYVYPHASFLGATLKNHSYLNLSVVQSS